MKNIKNNSISLATFLSFLILSFVAFCFMPNNASAYYYVGWVNGNYIGCETNLDPYGNFVGCGNTNTYQNENNYINNIANPIPSIYSISPNSVKSKNTPATITVIGSKFMPSSVVRFNNSDRPTTYINSETLKAQLSSADLSRIGSYAITVGNVSPGGGLSNAVTFNVNSSNQLLAPATTTSTNSDINNNDTSNDLSANALSGSKFMPTGFWQWVFVIILMLFIVFLWRKLFASNRYQEAPLKHA